ncbi:MAG: transposase [Prevotellaceae bacterium]|jgi:DNA-binding XRE family transcriptional regulator|nr:transposase [Prevotellaceae bacterium]
MKRSEANKKKIAFIKLCLSVDYAQKEMSRKSGVSEQAMVQWVKELPACRLSRVKTNLFKELERLSKKPKEKRHYI